jgi:hypothetical protein
LTGKDATDFYTYRKMKNDLAAKIKKASRTYSVISKYNEILTDMLLKIINTNPGLQDFQNYEPQSNAEVYVKKVLLEHLGDYKDFADFRKNEVDDALKHFNEQRGII